MLRLGLSLALASVLIIATTEPARLDSGGAADWASPHPCTGEQMRRLGASCEDPNICTNACARYCGSLRSCYQCCEEFAAYPDDYDYCREHCDNVFNPDPQGP